MAETAIKTVTEAFNNDRRIGDPTIGRIEPKDFFWDQFIKYISSAILALTIINFSIDFLQGGGVVCFPPSDTAALVLMEDELYAFNRDQGIYLNNYCAKSVPITEFFPVYVLIHGLLLVAPHYIWSALFKGDFDSFFDIAEKFDRLRDRNTGEYDVDNFDRVAKLELEYGDSVRMFATYVLKLILQFMVCVGSVALSGRLFIDFAHSFHCPHDFSSDSIPHGWPLNTTILCVYRSLRILSLVRYADFVLNALAGVLALYGLLWCAVRHTQQLGHVSIARFSFQSCLNPDGYVPPPIISWPSYPCSCCGKESSAASSKMCTWYLTWVFTHYPRIHFSSAFEPRIKSDLNFLLMILFRADSSHGRVFKNILVSVTLSNKVFD